MSKITDEIRKEASKFTKAENERIRNSKHIKNTNYYDRKMNSEGMNSYKSKLTENTNIVGSNDESVMNKYNTLLKGKITDPILKKDIIKNADKIIKHRISMTVIVSGNSLKDAKDTIKGSFTVTGILPEDELEIMTYWIGLVIGSNEWNIKLDEFRENMSSKLKDVYGIVSEITPRESMVIKEADIITTFK